MDKNSVFFAGTLGEYYARIATALDSGETLFLGNPHWSAAQSEEANRLTHQISGTLAGTFLAPKIFIATGGTGGKIRFIGHTAGTLEASARGLIAQLQNVRKFEKLCCFSCLPPWHISGLMPFVRARVSGGKFFCTENGSFRKNAPLPQFREGKSEFWKISLVPAQLFRLLENPAGAAWLREFDFVLLGGAGVPADLLARAQREKITLGVGYGMTETASLVALGTAPDFLAGTVLPHAKIEIGAGGRIKIAAGSLSPDCGAVFETNDEGFFDAAGKLHVLGRLDRFINSGGEKIDPKIVEAAILATGLATGTRVFGEPDAEWGERVVALLTGTLESDVEKLRIALAGTLARYMLPKRFICVPELPLDRKSEQLLHGKNDKNYPLSYSMRP